jgi:hypothetical protein
MHFLYLTCAFATKIFFRLNLRTDQVHQNLVLLLSIRRKSTLQYCFKVDHLLKLLKCCTSLNFSFRTLVNKLKYIKFQASKDDQLWDNTVHSIFVWLIKANRGFVELDQFYKFYVKKIFDSERACRVQTLRAGKKNFLFESIFSA